MLPSSQTFLSLLPNIPNRHNSLLLTSLHAHFPPLQIPKRSAHTLHASDLRSLQTAIRQAAPQNASLNTTSAQIRTPHVILTAPELCDISQNPPSVPSQAARTITARMNAPLLMLLSHAQIPLPHGIDPCITVQAAFASGVFELLTTGTVLCVSVVDPAGRLRMYAPERNSPGRAKESSLWADVGVALGSFGLLYDVTMRVRKRPPRVKSARCVSVSDVPRVDLDEFCVSWIPFNAAGGAVVRGGGGHVGDDLAVLHGGLCGEESRVASLSAVDMWIKANATVLKRVGYDFCLEHVKIYARLMHECVVSSGACVIGKGVITCSVFIPRRRFDAAWVRIIDFLEDHATRGEFPINVAVLAQLVTGSPCHFAANRASGTGILVTFVTSVCTKGLKEAMKELIVQVVRDHEARLLPEPSVGELGLVDIWRLQRGFSRHVQDFEDVRTRVLNVGYGKALCAEFKHFWIDEDSRIQEDRLSPVSSASGTEFPSIAHTKAEGETYTGQEVYETAVVQDWSDLSSDEYEVVEEELFMATRLSTARADRFKRKLAAVSTERWVDVATGEIRCMWMYICVYVIIWFAFFGNEVRQSIRR